MVARFLIMALFLAAAHSHATVWGGQARQMCLSCHPSHHAEGGRCPGCHRGNPQSERKNIAHAGMVPGKYARYTLGDASYLESVNRLMEQYACRRCHLSGGRGNRLAVSLDSAATRKTPQELAESIRRPVDNMPNFGLDEERITLLVNAILAGSQGHAAEAGAPLALHFTIAKNRRADAFTVRCGACHRLLSERRGALGTGSIGPNLSGLFSPYYPKTFRTGAAWTGNNLNSWLKNPRQVRPWAKMRPMILSDKERQELASIFQVTSDPDK